jgi:hypothetical protein
VIEAAKKVPTAAARKAILTEGGLSLPEFPHYVLQSKFFPGIDETGIMATEVLHLEQDGLLGAEGYQVRCKRLFG